MNGRSSENNVEIKSKQQVCVVFFFFFFFISLALHFAMTGRKGRKRQECVRPMNERERRRRGKGREGTVYHTLASS